jgi:hypothetical protein
MEPRQLAIRSIWCSLLAALVVGVTPAAGADIQKELANCAGIAGERERLGCYDSMARHPVGGKEKLVYVRVRKNLKSEWALTREDRVDGGQNVYLRLPSHDLWVRSDEKADIAGFTELRPTFWVRCVDGRTSAFVDWGIFLNAQQMKVFFKVDGNPVVKRILKVDATR